EHAVAGGQRHLHARAAGIHVGDADGVAVGRAEGQRAVLAHGLGGRHGVHGGVVDGVDGDGDRVDVAESAAGAGVALVVGGDGEVGGVVVVAGRGEGQAVQHSVDVGLAAGEDDGTGAIAGDRDPGDAGDPEHAVGGGEGDLHARAAGIDVGDRDRVAVGHAEGQRAVLAHGLGGRHGVHGGVVDGVDGDGDGVGVAERAAGAGVALVVGGDGQVGGAVVVAGRGEGQAVQHSVDVGLAAGEDDGTAAIAGDRDPGDAGDPEHAVGRGER